MILEPDSPLVADLVASPNVEPRLGGLAPSIVLMHYTGLETVERSLDVLSRPDCKVSCHYVVDVDGRVIQMVPESLRAWHAGVSSWQGETDINSASIGIEIQNAGHSGGLPDFPAPQMWAVAALARDIAARHAIPPERVLAHSDVAPARKIDPGEKFDWRWLASQGVGLWVPPASLDPSDAGLDRGAEHETIAVAQALLARYGYGIARSGVLDEPTHFVLRAFQLHFRPARVDCRLDGSTLETLRRLIDALPAPSEV